MASDRWKDTGFTSKTKIGHTPTLLSTFEPEDDVGWVWALVQIEGLDGTVDADGKDRRRVIVDLRLVIGGVEVKGSNILSSWGVGEYRLGADRFACAIPFREAKTVRIYVHVEDNGHATEVATASVLYEYRNI